MSNINNAIEILKSLGLPREQHNERTALCLLALLNLHPDQSWNESQSPLIGITPMMDFARDVYAKTYAPNTRETFRRFSMHQMVDAGLALLNPDKPDRPVNSPKTVYQIEPSVLELLKSFGTKEWDRMLEVHLASIETLRARYANERKMLQIPVHLANGKDIKLSPGEHSLLIKAIIEEFASRFVPEGQLVYAGDTGDKWGYFDEELLSRLGVNIESHGKMPDVVLFYPEKNWLLLIESVTSHGPVDGKRHEELRKLFKQSSAPLVYVTAFPSRRVMAPYLGSIAWETEVWCADAPTHLIHFNGVRFLGPYET
ncbi:BsuBI/PstI family type II restriction endonuclease [Rurimicrobium arvi]|uniref:BsuBI/PstI family type II restriction endonuclease n=1 Tax=Rurimicrobium arvi TaxID=2049916 RepID=A0ABP8MXV9_9BACT